MEPKSGFYTSPVAVLDFRSLYPSCIIAYNLCYSTCLGKIQGGETKRLGVMAEYETSRGLLRDMAAKEEIYTAPNRVMFAKAGHRRGILPRMLREILDTRVMVSYSQHTCRTPFQAPRKIKSHLGKATRMHSRLEHALFDQFANLTGWISVHQPLLVTPPSRCVPLPTCIDTLST